MLREIRELGFDWAELSHGIRISLLPGILEAVDAGEMKISSLHNFCPLPMGVMHAAPNIFQFSSPDERERDRAYRHSMKTIETAARLKAPAVVLHMGSIEMKEYTDRLIEMVGEKKRETSKYASLCEDMTKKRDKKKDEFVQRSSEMLDRLVIEAELRGLKLGVENREALEEIPLESDFPFLMREFDRPGVGYWHDTGHAQIKENLGFINHVIHLNSLASRLIGMHVHDVSFPGRDHCAPGSGMIDFAALKPMIKPDTIKVFELSPRLSVDEVKRGIAHIKSLWGDE